MEKDIRDADSQAMNFFELFKRLEDTFSIVVFCSNCKEDCNKRNAAKGCLWTYSKLLDPGRPVDREYFVIENGEIKRMRLLTPEGKLAYKSFKKENHAL
jgi:hypothetical protein